MDYENDELIFLAEDDSKGPEEILGFWNILVVDDDEEIHTVTRLALADLNLNGKKLQFHHAYSGKEAMEMMKELGSSLAIVLLDVVMETDDAGLVVVRHLRENLKLDEPRIILRTGQPGYAPEESVIKDFDINDYKTKTELTRNKLVTTIIAGLRSYQQILTINQSRIGLEKIIRSSANLLEEHSIKGFCEGIVTQISSLVGLDAGGIVCARAGKVLDKDEIEENEDLIYVLGAAGEFAQYINEKLESVHDQRIIESVNRCFKSKSHVFEKQYSVLFLNSSGYEAAVFINLTGGINEIDKKLLEVFVSNISVGYQNVNLFHELSVAAYRDWLTKLPNRNEFINMLNDTQSKDHQNKQNVVALMDINHFSDVNDGLGQDAGNNLLVSVAERIQNKFGEKIRMGRIGADIFGIIGREDIVNPERIKELFAIPFKAGDHTLPISIAIGLCKLVDESCSGINLLKQTNIALNLAKRDLNSNFSYYDPEMEEKTTWRLGLIRQLRTDFSARKLEVWFQPQVDLVTEQIVGMEALLRWPKDDGFIPPDVFVPLAEYSGLIIDIGAWVLEESCKRLKDLVDHGYLDIRVAVNISMPQFRDPEFVNLVKQAVTKHDIKASNLELEITESVAMDEPQIVIESLKKLKEFGVTIAIDDFGTGFSSMSYLQQLPFDRLKVDRSFINEIKPNQSAFIAETIVTLGNKMGLQTIAEGIERREQASYMLKLGCDAAQGYLYAKPMPFDALLSFLKDYKP